MKRLKSEVWYHFSLAPMDSLKALCLYCDCVINWGKKRDVGTSWLMWHLYRRHSEVVGAQKGFLGASLANSPDATLASAESSSKTTGLPVVVRRSHQALFPSAARRPQAVEPLLHFSVCSVDSIKAVCLHCSWTISRGKKPTNLGSSCLLRHLQSFQYVLKAEVHPKTTLSSSPGVQGPLSTELLGRSSFNDPSEKFYDSHPIAKKNHQSDNRNDHT
ncbi:Hypothetical predicted protein [Marmota monax]|uniref:BED-type domain-containing protein n=1 Tax=Marmota monax TaxID=9995 RepID=A0A5E4C7F5_MARMO|nr:Hypothetical predicted protein [Marmota monax]